MEALPSIINQYIEIWAVCKDFIPAFISCDVTRNGHDSSTSKSTNSSAIAYKGSSERAQMVTSTPSLAHEIAQAFPNPLEDAQTISFFP